MSSDVKSTFWDLFEDDLNKVETERDKLAVIRRLEELNIIPFDVRTVITVDPLIFGYLGDGENIGKRVRTVNVPLIVDVDEESQLETSIDVNNQIGIIIGDFKGRVVIQFFDRTYLGWVDDSNWVEVLVHDPHFTIN